MNLNLTKQQIQNLINFLNRVQLNGAEAEALVELKMIIGRAIQSEQVINAPIKKDKTENKDGKK